MGGFCALSISCADVPSGLSLCAFLDCVLMNLGGCGVLPPADSFLDKPSGHSTVVAMQLCLLPLLASPSPLQGLRGLGPTGSTVGGPAISTCRLHPQPIFPGSAQNKIRGILFSSPFLVSVCTSA